MTVAAADASRHAQRSASACSFDVFDTFLLRACTTPEGVYERAYELGRISQLCPNVSASFVQHRLLAEKHARRGADERGAWAEAHIADIYSYFPFSLFGLDRSALKDLVEAELCAELDLCRANPEMVRRYSEMRAAGYRVGFISDTYWNSQQLARLLHACSPGLSWDFLYASCDHGSGKNGKLFEKYLSEQAIDAARSIHIGDNEIADIAGAQRHGIEARHYPQASDALISKLHRETTLFELLCPNRPSRLDHGARTLRRMIATQSPEQSTAHHLGLTVLGPVMMAFHSYIEARRQRLANPGRRVALAFLGRDGFLSYRIWQDTRGEQAAYLEINRRLSVLGASHTLEPLCDLINSMPKIDVTRFEMITSVLPPRVKAYLAKCPGGAVTGPEFSKALPGLLDTKEIGEIAAGIRTRLLAYLRTAIPDFDSCTDLMLVDLGYAGTTQKALRRVLDREGISIRLHGTYLLALEDSFYDVPEGDTAEGLITDLVITPHAKRGLLRNIGLLEQLCSSGEGSTRDYRDGEVLREDDLRPVEQTALVSEIQTGARRFVACARELAQRYALQPYAAQEVMARWTAAILGRLLQLPDDGELALFSGFKHDISLGARKLVPMIDIGTLKNQVIARGFASACTTSAPPIWMAGSFAGISPSHAYLNLLFTIDQLPGNVFGEAPCGSARVGLFGKNGQASIQTVTFYQSGLGELRLRVPVAQGMAITTIALPLGQILRDGILHGVVLQYGASVALATNSPEVVSIADERLICADLERSGSYYRTLNDKACLLIPVDPLQDRVAIYTIAVSPLNHARMMTATNHA